MKQLYLVLLFLIGLAHTAIGATYYVDASGSDASGDGSVGKPWRSLRYAVSKVPASQGHIIKLSAGTFIEGGLIEVPLGVSIEGAGKDQTILKADPSFYYNPATPGYALDKYLISLNEYNPRNGNQHLKNFTINGDGKKLHGGIYVRNRSFVVIDGVKVTGTNFNGIWLWDVKDSRLTNTDLINCSWGSDSYQVGALNLGNLERVEIDHCYIDENTGYGIKAIGPSGYNDMLYSTIHDCTVTVNPQGLWNNGSAPNIAIELWMVDPVGCEIYNNYIDNTVSLINANNNASTGVQTIRLHHNTIDIGTRANGSGYAIELTMHDVEVDHNYIIKGSYGIANWGNPMKNWKIHHNTFYGIQGTYPGEIVRSQWGGLHNVDFFNNTVEFAGTKTASVIGLYGGASDNVRLKNNLLINNNTAYSYYPNKLIHVEGGATINSLAVTHNLLFNLPVGTVAGTYSNNLTGDPSITKTGNRPDPYYQLATGSAAIDAGTNVGFAFKGTAPDIGAFESGATTSNQAPVATITSPANNAAFTAGTAVVINATASDSDGTVSKVEFFNGSTKLGEDLTSPYSFTWSNVAAGTYSLTAKATDNKGTVKTSAAVSITVNAANAAPTVSITSPANNGAFTAGSAITINATASDSDGTVSKVEFFNGTVKLGEDLTSPYSFTWSNVAAGTYSLTAKATDNKGAVKTSAAVSITVNAANAAPTVSITSPVNNGTFTAGNSITINANASDSDGISKVAFFKGSTKLGEDLTSPYSFAWSNVAAGTYSLTAKATDKKGSIKTSAAVSITVNIANAAPTVSITSPVNNGTFTAGNSITINANASDSDGTISKVAFFNGSTKLGEDLTSPYSFAWSNVAAGSYSLTVKAIDNKGAVKTSAAISITVSAQANSGGDFVKLGLYATDATLSGKMKLTSDPTASKGSYFSMPFGSGTNYYIPPSSHADFNFTLDKTDTYVVWVRIKSPAANNQGYLVYDGRGNWTTWLAGIHNEWTWVKITDVNTKAVTTFNYVAGANLLRLAWHHENAQVDRILVTNDMALVPDQVTDTPEAPPAETAVKLGLFAPDASLRGSMKLTSDATALKGSYFSVPQGAGTNYYIPPSASGTFSFALDKTDAYEVWVRMKSPAASSQGFLVYDGKGRWITWLAGVHTEWTWVKITDASTQAPVSFPFTAGTNTLGFGWYHENVKVDAVIITNDKTFVPSDKDASTARMASEEEPLANSVAVYPNPVRDKFTISIDADLAQEAQISIRNATSLNERKMTLALQPGANSIQIDMATEQKGLYLVTVITSGGIRSVTKIIVAD